MNDTQGSCKGVTAYLISHFHYDVAYMKTYEEYLPDSFLALQEALSLLRDNPDYTFLVEQVILIEEFLNHFPERLDEFRRYCHEGRIEVAPGMFCMPDMNLPGGEAFVRQVLYGRKWMEDNLGVAPTTCWIADCWGHHRQLPQILSKCGYDAYAFSRAKTPGISNADFVWRGLDGTEILTHWMPLGYGSDGLYHALITENEAALEEILRKESTSTASNHILLCNGGDFCVPGRNVPDFIRRWNTQDPNREITVIFSTPKRFFEAVRKEIGSLPVLQDDLNPLFQGSYSTRIRVKQYNRRLENKLVAAEKIWSLNRLSGRDYPKSRFDSAWKVVLTNQFHDLICGTVIDDAFDEMMFNYKAVEREIDALIREGIWGLVGIEQDSSCMTSKPKIAVFNPLMKPRNGVAEFMITTFAKGVKDFIAHDSEGRLVPSQVVHTEFYGNQEELGIAKAKVLLDVSVPPLGVSTYEINEVSVARNLRSDIFVREDCLENDYIVAKLDRGLISSLKLKGSDVEFVDQRRPYFNDMVAMVDRGDPWFYEGPIDGAWLEAVPFRDPMPEPSRGKGVVFRGGFYSRNGIREVQVIETGPVRGAIRVAGSLWNGAFACPFIQYTYIYAGSPRIEFITEFQPKGRYYRIKVCFPTAIREGRILHEIPFGMHPRPEGEYPAQNQICYENDEQGLCLLNRGLPGNNVTDGVMMLSLLRSVNMMRGERITEGAFEEGVMHRFEYSIVPYLTSSKDTHPMKWGQEYNQPLLTVVTSGRVTRPSSQSFYIQIDPENVLDSAFFVVEGALVVRLFESEGRATTARLRINFGFNRCFETNLIYTKVRELPVSPSVGSSELFLEMGPFEIKTLLFEIE